MPKTKAPAKKPAHDPWTVAVAEAQPRAELVEKRAGPGMSTFAAEVEFARQLLAEAQRKASERGKKAFLVETLKANPSSLADALVALRATQLTLNPVLRLAYLVPRDGRIILEPSYKGLIFAARKSGEIDHIDAAPIFDGDDWEHFTDERGEHFRHVPAPGGERGELVAAFAWARLVSGSVYVKRLEREDIEKRRRTGKSGDSPAWRDWYSEMSCAKAVRHLFRYLPVSTDSPLAATLDLETEPAAAGIDGARDVTPEPLALDGLSPVNGEDDKGELDGYRPSETPASSAGKSEAKGKSRADRPDRVKALRGRLESAGIDEAALLNSCVVEALETATDSEFSKLESRLTSAETARGSLDL